MLVNLKRVFIIAWINNIFYILVVGRSKLFLHHMFKTFVSWIFASMLLSRFLIRCLISFVRYGRPFHNYENVTFYLPIKIFHQYIFHLPSFSLVICNHSLAMILQRTYTHKPPKPCSATLIN